MHYGFAGLSHRFTPQAMGSSGLLACPLPKPNGLALR